MASTGKKGKKNKGKTVPLNHFLSGNTISWIDQVDEADKLGEFNRKPALPAAPRAARAIELDESRIPKNPPFVAYLSNLSYELEENDIYNSFPELSISNVRLPRDERSGRLKGFGYVEFNDRGSFISALQKLEATIKGRRIKIDVAENEGERRRGGPKDNRDRDSNYDPERTMGDWRSGSRSEFASNDDRRGPMSGRKEYGGFRDRDGFDRDRNRRESRDGGSGGGGGGERESSWRNNERRAFGNDRDRDRDRDRDSRSSFGSRRGFNESEGSSEPRTRTKLNLKPRSVPAEEIVSKEEPVKKEEDRPEPEKPPAASIFGKAKPVDTAAREREIEQRLEKEREGGKNEKDFDTSKRSEESSSSDVKGSKPASDSKENVWVRKSLKIEPPSVTSKGPSGKPDDLEEPPPGNDSDKETSDYHEDSSRYSESKGNDEYDDDRDGDGRYNRPNRNDNRNDRNREGDRAYRRDDKWRDDKDRRREPDRRDRGYDSDRRGGNGGGRNRDQERDGDYKRFNERDGDRRYSEKEDHKRFSNDRDGDNKRFQERDAGRYKDQDDQGSNKGPRGERRPGPPIADKGGPRPVKTTQERERGPQIKEKPRDQKKPEDGIRMPKFKEATTPNYIGTNKYSFLEDGTSE